MRCPHWHARRLFHLMRACVECEHTTRSSFIHLMAAISACRWGVPPEVDLLSAAIQGGIMDKEGVSAVRLV
jgi:hypothetical protein